MATIGNVSNKQHKFEHLSKAGSSFYLGKKPVVRGVAKNPCDHPHGGGEGKKSKSVNPKSPWGWLTTSRASNLKKYEILKKKKF